MMSSEQLIQDLINRTDANIKEVEKLKSISVEKLNRKETKERWSILECLEHLNLYGDFYIPEIKRRIENSNTLFKEKFTPGFLGNYFAKSMLPSKGMKKMKTFKNKNPNGSKLSKSTIERFIFQQNRLLDLLGKSKAVDLNKTKTAISISKLIKLKLGDTFRVVIYHNERHIKQANNLLS